MPIVYAVALIAFLATPTLLSITSQASLQRLQQAQDFTTGTQAASGDRGAQLRTTWRSNRSTSRPVER